LESASIVYPRLTADPSLPVETGQAQNRMFITYVLNNYTNDVNTGDEYRQRILCETKTFELKDVKKTAVQYSLKDFKNILSDTNSVEIAYHNLNAPPIPGKAQRRLIEQIKSFFYKNDLTDSLPLKQIESKAIAFENYQLAYTPPLLENIFGPINLAGSKINDALMAEGKFTHCKDENNIDDINWWIRSGTIQYIEGIETVVDAENRFFVPISYTEPFGAKTKVKYFSDYFLMIEETEDALLNINKVLTFNLRTLSPQRIQDANNNISEVYSDELGLVKALALFGKGNEADDLSGINEFTSNTEEASINDFFNSVNSTDLITFGKSLLKHASAFFVYDLHRYENTNGK
jgi:hypothetical protein